MKSASIIYGYHESGHYFVAKAIAELIPESIAHKSYNLWKDQSPTIDYMFDLFRGVEKHGLEIFPDFLNNKEILDILSKEIVVSNEILDSDMIICTHPYSSYVVAENLRNEKTLLISVHTDFTEFPVITHPRIDIYTGVFKKRELSATLNHKSRIMGLPVKKSFLPGSKDGTILVLGGSDGFGQIESVYKWLRSFVDEKNIVVITGRNENLEKKLKKEHAYANVVGFTEDIFKYFRSADFVVSKASGSTISEAIVSECIPLFVPSKLPWEEEASINLAGRGVGIKLNMDKIDNRIINELMNNSSLRDLYLKRIRDFKRNVYTSKINELFYLDRTRLSELNEIFPKERNYLSEYMNKFEVSSGSELNKYLTHNLGRWLK